MEVRKDAPRGEDVTGVSEDALPAPRMGRYRQFRRGLRVNPLLDWSWRIAVLTVGGLVVAAGVALLALPGPGWATIFVGLMILASEFAWARRSLDWTKDKAREAHARATAPEVRRRNQALTAVAAFVALVAVAWYLIRFGFPGPLGTAFEEAWQR